MQKIVILPDYLETANKNQQSLKIENKISKA